MRICICKHTHTRADLVVNVLDRAKSERAKHALVYCLRAKLSVPSETSIMRSAVRLQYIYFASAPSLPLAHFRTDVYRTEGAQSVGV